MGVFLLKFKRFSLTCTIIQVLAKLGLRVICYTIVQRLTIVNNCITIVNDRIWSFCKILIFNKLHKKRSFFALPYC